MKNFTNNFKQFTSRLSARWLIMALMLLVGTSSAWAAQYNLNWQGKVYFLVPETWDISTYSYVQVDITRTTSANSSNYQFYAGKMTRIGTSRLFYLKLSADHSGWGQNEYITFTANDHEYNSGTFNINGNHYYATPLDYGCNNSSNYYLFKPSTESQFTTTTNGNTLTANYNSSRDNVLKADQTVNIYTNGSSSADGGSVSLKGYYFTSDTEITSSTANSSGASGKYGAVIGSEMTLTASANTGYEFDGWYNEASGGTLLSSSATYTYNVYGTKTIYARFTQSCTPPDAPFEGVAQSETICAGSYTFNSDYKWYTTLNGSTTVSGSITINANTTYYIAKEGNDGCESTRTTYTINVNPIPSFSKNPTNKSICIGDSEDNLTTLSGVAVNNGSPVWYNAQTGGSKVNAADVVNGGTYWVAAENATTGCKNATRKQFVLTVNPRPEAPTFDAIPAKCGSYTLPTKDKNQVNVNWYTAATGGNKITSVNTTGTYHAEAVDGTCISASRTPVQITINTIPTISISGSEEAVLYEDVTLTATATDGATVKWYEGVEEKGEGLTYVVTSETATSKTITAKAFLNGCESAEVSKKVTFSAEDCNSTTITDLIITCNPNGYYGDVYLHIWPNGESSLQSWPGFKGEWKDNVWRWEISASLLSTSKQYDIIFNNNAGAQTQDLDHNLIPGNQYNYTLNHTDWGNGNNRPTMGKVDPIPLSQPATISAPTVKTVYAESDEGEGNIRFKGQVVKTGCNEKAKLAVQYKLHENNSYTTYYWNNEDKLVDIEAGKEFEITLTNIPDGTYDVRARIYVSDDLKGYGEVITIPVSTIKEPITSVTLTHVKDVNGTAYSDQELENLIYCAGETVWFKLEQNGSKFQDYQWISYPGTDLVGMYAAGTFSFTITDSGNVGIRLKNDANDDWVESNLLGFNTHPVAISPTISFENATICSNSTATLKLGALVVGQSYELYKEIENEGVYSEERVGDVTLTCNSIEDDLKFTGLNESGKYFVKGYTAQCPDYKASSQTATLEIVDASSVYITLNPTEATTTPWMPVKLTVVASDDYTLEVPEGVEFNQNGNICSVKIPLPNGATGGEGQNENVSFPQNAITSYTVTANLVSIGGEDNPCAVPATATITLTPYVEECTEGH